MADKELPPLRIRLTGDSTDFDKSVDSAINRLKKSFASLKFDVALQDARMLAATINNIRMNALLTQAQQTKTVLKDLARIKMTPLDSELDKIVKKLKQMETLYGKFQTATFKKNSGGVGATAATAAAAAASSIAKSISDAVIKSAPHLGKVIIQAFQSVDKTLWKFADSLVKSVSSVTKIVASIINSAGKVFVASANLFSNALKTVGTAINFMGNAVKSAASIISSAANVFRSLSTVVVASLRSASQVFSAAIRGSAQVASAAIRSAGQVASSAIQSAGRVAAATISASVNSASRIAVSAINTLGRTIVGVSRSAATVVSSGIRAAGQMAASAIRGAAQMGTQLIRTAGQIATTRMRISAAASRSASSRSSAVGGASGVGGGLGDGLTSRADIYMHDNALRALSQSGKGLLDLRINLQQAEIGIRAFTGNAQASASVMAELRDHAEKTSFTTLGLSEAVRNMMSYGLSARDAVDSAKMLGDVSAGNALRFERLAFAMSQITSMGLLQGNELRQLTEQGFNPLETIAKRTGLSMLELRKMMERGQITSKHVTEALKIETSAGGRFADMQKKMAKSLGGVIAQATELTMNLKSDLLGLLERDMIAAVSTFINYLKQLQAYLATPKGKKFARDMMNIAKYTLLAVASFHIVGFAVASVMWWIQSAVSTVSRLTFIFRLLGIIGSAAISILTSPFALVMAAIAAAIVAVGYFSGAVAGPNSAYSAMLALWDITQWFFNNAVGFFQNFQWNWTVLTLWFQTQWKNILSDMVDGGAAMVSATIDNFVTMFRMIGRLWVVFGTWLFSLYEGLFSGEIYEAMVSGFVKVFTWLEKKWKDLGTFVGKIWENLFDPAALYDVMMEGMGLDQVQQTMTEDIMRTREKGLFAGIEGVVKDELGNFKTGLEDFKPTTNTGPLSLLNFSQTDKSLLPPKAPELPDAAAYKGAGFGDLKGGMGTKLASVAAMSYGSSAYSEKLAEQAARFDFSGKPRQNPLVAGQQQTNTILGKILNALNGKPGVNLQPAAVAGGGTTP